MAVGRAGVDPGRWGVAAIALLLVLALWWVASRSPPPSHAVAIDSTRRRTLEPPPANPRAEPPRRDVPAEVDAPHDVEATPAAGDDRPGPSLADLDRWIRDLHDDDVRWNAMNAMSALTATGADAVPALEDALLSFDRQQRLFAAAVLRSVDAPPTPRLLEACVEQLALEPTSAARYLARHADLARQQLRFGLGSDSAQERLYCAFLLACGGHDEDLPRICSTLIEHLRDNEVSGDAVMAAHGLWRLGSGAIPHLHAAMAFADPQAQRLLRLIELDLRSPPRDEAERRRRRAMHDVTDLYHDPVVEYDVQRSWLPRW